MRFKTQKVITGIEQKVSKKTGNPYRMVNYLNENGSTFSSMVEEGLVVPEGLKQLSSVEVEFEVTFYNGNVSGLRTVDLKLVKVA